MARNVAIMHLRGPAANIPALEDGEFYLAIDTGQLYVGLDGFNFKIGAPIVANVSIQGNAFPTHFLEPNADGSIPVSGTITATPGAGVFATDDASSSTPSNPVPASAMYMGGNKAGNLAGLLLDANGNLSVNVSDVGGNAATGKGVQPAAALPTQDLKDSGRTYITLYVDRIAGATTEALVTMSINKGGVLTSGTSYTVTAGKTFRIQAVNAEILNTTTVANRVSMRVRAAASVLVTSPIIAMAMAAASAALAASGATDPHAFPDGLEIPSGQQIGISQLATVTTAGIVSMTVVGYEY